MPSLRAVFSNLGAEMPLGRKVQRISPTTGPRSAPAATAAATTASPAAERSSRTRVPSRHRAIPKPEDRSPPPAGEPAAPWPVDTRPAQAAL